MATETILPVTRRCFSVEDFYRMAKAGILREDDRVELIRGDIVQMVPIGSQHASIVSRLSSAFARLLVDSAIVWGQNPIHVDDNSEPQPDVCLLRVRSDAYFNSHPTPGDVLLLIEVSDSSLAYDRLEKLPLYATASIPEVWIVNLVDGAIEVSRAPTDGVYSEHTVLLRGTQVSPLAFPNVRLAVNDVLGDLTTPNA